MEFTSKLHGREILTPCNFEVNPVTHFGVISLFSSNFQHFNTFRPLFQKLLEIDVKFNFKHVGYGIYFKIAW
jgi:hypothetical protein